MTKKERRCIQMTKEKRATGYLVYPSATKERNAVYLNADQMGRAMRQSLTGVSNSEVRLPDPTTATRVVALYGRGT